MRKTWNNIPEGHSFGSIIKEHRMKAGLTQQAFAEKLGVTRNTVLYWESDKKRPSVETLREVCRLLDSPVSELLKDEADTQALNADERRLLEKFAGLNLQNQKLIFRFMDSMLDEQRSAQEEKLRAEFTIYGVGSTEAAAGCGNPYSDVANNYCFLRVSNRSRNADWIVGVTGNSMTPDYRDGEKVFVRQTEDVSPGDIVVVNTPEGLVIKLLNEDYQLESLNPDYPFVGDDSASYHIFGKVVGKVSVYDQPTPAEKVALAELFKDEVANFCIQHDIPM